MMAPFVLCPNSRVSLFPMGWRKLTVSSVGPAERSARRQWASVPKPVLNHTSHPIPHPSPRPCCHPAPRSGPSLAFCGKDDCPWLRIHFCCNPLTVFSSLSFSPFSCVFPLKDVLNVFICTLCLPSSVSSAWCSICYCFWIFLPGLWASVFQMHVQLEVESSLHLNFSSWDLER